MFGPCSSWVVQVNGGAEDVLLRIVTDYLIYCTYILGENCFCAAAYV